MRIFAVSGFSKTGKTTTVEALLRVLTKRGYSTATVKDTCCQYPLIANSAVDTERHRSSGASITVLRGIDFTATVENRQLSLSEIICSMIEYDVTILEGFKSLDVPKIVTATSTGDALATRTAHTFAFSGKLALNAASFLEIPVLSCLTDAEELVDIALGAAWNWNNEMANDPRIVALS